MAEWLTVEVVDAELSPTAASYPPPAFSSAAVWRSAHGEDLVEAAVTHGALYWEWHETRWGVVLELVFRDDEQLDRYRGLPAVRAALDAVPDPAQGLAVYRGRGGGSGARVPLRPRPSPVAGAAAWPAPDAECSVALEQGRFEVAGRPAGEEDPQPAGT
jgi:hypothetical protein